MREVPALGCEGGRGCLKREAVGAGDGRGLRLRVRDALDAGLAFCAVAV